MQYDNKQYCLGQGGHIYNAYLRHDSDVVVDASKPNGGKIDKTLTHFHNEQMGVMKFYSNGKMDVLEGKNPHVVK